MSLYSTSWDTEGLISWLISKGVDSEDCEKIRKSKFRGASFIKIDKDEHFKEIGIPLGSRLYLEDLIKVARAEAQIVGSAPVNHGLPRESAIPLAQGPVVPRKQAAVSGGLTMNNLSRELDSLIEWKKFAVALNVLPSEIQKIASNNRNDIDEQKMSLFSYIERNSESHGFTWVAICEALEDFEGNLALQLRQKYCNPDTLQAGCSKMETETILIEDKDQLGPHYLKAIQSLTFDVRSKWRPFGLEMGINPSTLEAIGTRYPNPDDCFRAVLEDWLRMEKPTFSTILEALRSPTVGYGGLASKIEKLDEDKKQKIGFYL